MLDHISESKADAAKFQYFRADKMYPEDTKVAEYLVGKGGIKKDTRIVDLLKRAEIPKEWLNDLGSECGKRSIDLIMSVFDVGSVNILVKHGIKKLKIASSEITHFPLLKVVGETGLPVILSTGVSNLGIIEKALETIGHDNVTLLHCTAAYPVPEDEANILAINTLQSAFGLPVGLSDHTDGILASVIAVSLNAVMIEKHFTIDKNYSDFHDHQLSADPKEMKLLVEKIKVAQELLGQDKKEAQASEKDNLSALRRSIVAKRDLAKDEIISREDMVWTRPGGGIPPGQEDSVIGKKVKQDIKKGTMILSKMITK